MNNGYLLNTIILFCISTSQLFSDYDVVNAFPSLTFNDPVGIYYAPDNSNRLFVLEQPGRIIVFNNDANEQQTEVFLDIESLVDQGSGYTEEGLLGLAFHPNFNENGYFYVNYTEYGPRRNVIARYTVSSDNPNYADHNSSSIILEVNQPYYNHNGGQMGFGPDDGYLYISFGDGGSGGDPQGNGQDLSTLLGTIIRIDIDNTDQGLNYSIPDDNPFIAPLAARDEIYAYGLRNMWRFSWDSETGYLWGADVGQNSYEEIDIIHSGLNYGWNTMEANHCFPTGSNCDSEGFEPPVWEYELYVNGVCSITGGFVYRGIYMPSLYGKYIYGDWCTGDIWALTYSNNGDHLNEGLIDTDINITSFGIDQNDELYFMGNESIYKFSPEVNFLMGDLNYDGEINILDVLQMVSYVLGNTEFTGEQEYISDLNYDDVINILDIIQIVNTILN
jgi:glucose/arabinose dehydrogenase